MIIDKTKLKEAAWLVREGSDLQGLHAEDAMYDFELLATPDAVLALLSEIDQLKGLMPEFPPRPPDGEGLPRYGLRWNGPQQPLAVQMTDGYWTPWHLADQLKAENEALRQSITDINSALKREYWSEYAGLDETRTILDAAMAKEPQP